MPRKAIVHMGRNELIRLVKTLDGELEQVLRGRADIEFLPFSRGPFRRQLKGVGIGSVTSLNGRRLIARAAVIRTVEGELYVYDKSSRYHRYVPLSLQEVRLDDLQFLARALEEKLGQLRRTASIA